MDDLRTNYLTAEGIKKLQEELDFLLNVRRPEVARMIGDAKADGDVSENAGYDEAKNAQAFTEGRIMTLQNILASAGHYQVQRLERAGGPGLQGHDPRSAMG